MYDAVEEADSEEITKSVSFTWNVDNVKSMRSDLTDEQAIEVLEHFKKARENMNTDWEILEQICGDLYPEDQA